MRLGLDINLASGGVSITPKTIFGSALAAWYRADLGIMTNGGNVSLWSDQSGNGYHLSQGSAPSQPPYNLVDAAVNNRSSLGNFDGTADFLEYAGTHPLSGVGACTIFVVQKYTSVGDGMAIAGGTLECCALSIASTQQFYISGTQWAQTAHTSTALDIAEYVFDGSLSGNANRLKMLINGTPKSLTFTGTIPATMPAITGLRVGKYNGTLFWYKGKIADLILVAGADTAKNATCRALLGQRYGVAVS